ncbi:uncharacterized protein N7484_003782 [Penicillium longicatenatum]|uniref:uncharacterized protein n=1 Tax=Penicillium longicatenatum TaxID=1561947 RepID=UPI0025475B69|nr:uncharacterized protein N7484_003782 [Penicillium longicatenatum]KAJ5650059.1 hypothetical protein N7484_003782 [Penicillium longicatenatum]
MARKKSKRSEVEKKSWSLNPDLHHDVCEILSEANLRHFKFHPKDDPDACEREYDTNIMGRFACKSSTCPSNGWSSKKIAITIRLYPGSRYNARVYHQRCKRCEALSRPKVDGSYAERVAYRIKVWSGIKVQAPFYLKKESKVPHNSRLCEGCKDGHCRELDG